MKIYPNLETERLLIRPTTIEDADFLCELMNSPKWLQFIGDRNVYKTEDVQKYIEIKMLPQWIRLGYTNNTVISKATQEKLGICGLFDREGAKNELEIGFAFLPEFEKKGYGFESTNRLIQFAFNQLNTNAINAFTDLKNKESQRLLEKLGFTYQGEQTDKNDNEVSAYYRLLNPKKNTLDIV